MTYFLDQLGTPPQIKAQDLGADIPSFWRGLAAATSRAALENDANFRAAREKAAVRDGIAMSVADRVGIDGMIRYAEANGSGFDHIRAAPADIESAFNDYGAEASHWFIAAAREMAEQDPAAWADIDLSDEAMDAEVNRRLQAEHAEAAAIVAMMPNGQGAANLVGGMVGATLDVKNIPFMLMGGPGGSFARVMGREALINMGAETAFLPSQFAMAGRLDIPDPNIAEHLAMAAVAGAGFGAGGEAVSRAFQYLTGRHRVPLSAPGRSDADIVALVDQAEDILAGPSTDPLGDIAAIVRRDQPVGMDDIPPAPWTEADVQSRMDPADEMVDEAIADYETWREAINDAILESDLRMKYKYPLAQSLATSRNVRGLRWKTALGDLTPVAQELRARGITPKTYPFLWRKNGRASLDNLVASAFDGLDQVIAVDPSSGYFDEQALMDAIVDELTTGRKTPLNAEVAGLMALLDSKAPDFSAMAPAPRRAVETRIYEDAFSIDPADYRARLGDGADAAIEADVDGWLSQNGVGDLLTAEQRAVILSDMKATGGELDSSLDRMWESIAADNDARAQGQEAIYDEIPYQDPVSLRANDGGAQGDVGPAGRAASGPEDATGRQAGSRPGDAADGAALRDESGAQPMEDEARPDGYADPVGAPAEPFSDPASPEARAIHDTMMADLRASADPADMIDMGDGKGARPLTEALDEIDMDDTFADLLDLCGKIE